MSTKNISDYLVCKAVAQYWQDNEGRTAWIEGSFKFPYDYIHDWTGEPAKVCYRAMERAVKNDLLSYGVSIRTAWLTDKGKAILENESPT
jgi:hypothetical protein